LSNPEVLERLQLLLRVRMALMTMQQVFAATSNIALQDAMEFLKLFYMHFTVRDHINAVLKADIADPEAGFVFGWHDFKEVFTLPMACQETGPMFFAGGRLGIQQWTVFCGIAARASALTARTLASSRAWSRRAAVWQWSCCAM